MKDKLGRKIMAKFLGLRVRTYAYLIDDSSQGKNQKDKKSVSYIENYKNCLEAT